MRALIELFRYMYEELYPINGTPVAVIGILFNFIDQLLYNVTPYDIQNGSRNVVSAAQLLQENVCCQHRYEMIWRHGSTEPYIPFWPIIV
jgi:hypothetical protein